MLKGKGKIWKASGSGGHVVYIPSDIIKDSAYPFEHLEDVDVQLDPKRKQLVITKVEAP